MTTNELIERYIYAATKRIPRRKHREDISRELSTLIDDMLTERCQGGQPQEKDVRVIFAEIGTPSEVYLKYSPNANSSLISGAYYDSYSYVLKIISLCIVCAIAVASVVMALTGSYSGVTDGIFSWLSSSIVSFCGVFTILTIMFAIFERKQVNLNELNEELNSLQPVPKKNEEISRTECIISIVMSALFAIIFLFVPQIIGIYTSNAMPVPIFNIDALRERWIFILLFAVICVFDQCLRLFERRYTLKVLVSAIASNVLSLIMMVLIFWPSKILNPEFISLIEKIFKGEAGNAGSIGDLLFRADLLFIGIILVAIIIDIVENTYKYFKNK